MINNILDKVGTGGTWLAALSCAGCFPALASLASGLGLGFLSHFEGIAINILLPIFATLTLLANLYSWYKNRNHIRGSLSVVGPIAVLFALYPLWQYDWSNYLFYFGICLIAAMPVLDIVKPLKNQTCKI